MKRKQICQLQTFLVPNLWFHCSRGKKKDFKAANMQECHRHNGFLICKCGLNKDVGCGRGQLLPEMRDVHYGTCKFLKKCIEYVWSESVCLHGQGAPQCGWLKGDLPKWMGRWRALKRRCNSLPG